MKSETALGHLPDRLGFAPTLHGDAINCDHGSGAVGPMLAVHQNRGALGVGDNLQETNHLLLLGVPGLHVDMFVGQSGIADFVAIRVKRPQVDDGFEAQIF